MIVVRVVVGAAIMTNRRLMGLSRSVIEDLVTEVGPRWSPRASADRGRVGRDRFVSGRARLNTIKALVICDPSQRAITGLLPDHQHTHRTEHHPRRTRAPGILTGRA